MYDNIAIINGVATMPMETLDELLERAAERGAEKVLEKNGVKQENPMELIPLSSIAKEYRIGIQTVRDRVNTRYIPTEKNPLNRKEKAIYRKDLPEILKNKAS